MSAEASSPRDHVGRPTKGRWESSHTGVGGRATLYDVAARAGVSIGTVSNYLHGNVRVSPETAKRVREAIGDLGYVANAAARTLKTGRTNTFTLAVSSLSQPYFAELAEQVIAAADARGCGVIVQSTGLSRSRIDKCIDMAKHGLTDGLIISPVLMGERDAQLFAGNYPLVLLGTQPFDAPCPNVTVDNVKASYDATMHLIHAGRTRVAFVGGEFGPLRTSRTCRARGYRMALEDAGLPFDMRLVRPVYDWNSLEGALAVDALLESVPDFDAVLACDDMLALGVMRRLLDRGRGIPDDVRVIGMDDVDQSRYAVPTLSTVDLGKQTVAEEAVRALLEQVEERRRGESSVRYVMHRLMFRDSSPAL